MKKIQLFLLFIAHTIWSCTTPKKDRPYDEIMSPINEYSALIKHEKKIQRSMHGLLSARNPEINDGKIHVISLGYCIKKNLKYDEARECFYSVVDGLIEHINKNTQLEKYLSHFPIDYSDLEIDFSFWVHDESHLKLDDVHSIHIGNNKIYYEIVNEEGPDEIKQDQIIPNVYTIQGMLERNRSIIRPISEDLAMHSKEK